MTDDLTPAELADAFLIDAVEGLLNFRRTVGQVNDTKPLCEYVERILHLANDLLVTCDETLRATTEPPADVLVDFIDGLAPDLARNLGSLRTTLEGLAHDAIERTGEVPLPDGRKAYATTKRARKRVDGALILGRLVSRCADDFGGEPPHAFAEMVANRIDAAAGVTNPSHAWRKGALAVEGIDLAQFTDSEPGAKTVGFTLAKATHKDEAAA